MVALVLYRDSQERTVPSGSILSPNIALEDRIKQLSLNTLVPLLELSAKVQKTEGSWKKAFKVFHIDSQKMVKKYRGAGTAAILSSILSKEYGGVHIKRELSIRYPTPNGFHAGVWEEATQKVGGFPKSLVHVSQEKQQYSVDVKMRKPIRKITKKRQDEREVKNPAGLIKKLMRIACFHRLRDASKKVECEINLFDGVLHVKRGKIEGLEKKTFLADMVERGDKDLQKVLGALQKAFALPKDFKKNFTYLLKNRAKLMEEVMLKPIKTYFDHWEKYCELEDLRSRAQDLREDLVETSKGYSSLNIGNGEGLETAEQLYGNALEKLRTGGDNIQQSLEKARQAYANFVNFCPVEAGIHHMTLNLF